MHLRYLERMELTIPPGPPEKNFRSGGQTSRQSVIVT